MSHAHSKVLSKIKPLPLIRGSQLLPFIEELRARRRDPVKLLKRCFCPVSADLGDPDCIIATSRLWQFVESASRSVRDINFGWTTAMNRGLYGGGNLGYQWENQQNLHDAMLLYANRLPRHASVSRGILVEEGESVWFCRGTLPPKGLPFSQVEQYALATMLHIVRRYLGGNWQPRRIKLTSGPPASGKLAMAACCDEIVFHAERAAIEVPLDRLDQGRKRIRHLIREAGEPAASFPRDLFEILVQMLIFYLPDYHLTLDEVSRIVELHPRVLNRRLAAGGHSFRDVRDTVNMNWAKKRLAENCLTIGEISQGLGYTNQSALSRAFTRVLGESPLEYRRRANAHSSD